MQLWLWFFVLYDALRWCGVNQISNSHFSVPFLWFPPKHGSCLFLGTCMVLIFDGLLIFYCYLDQYARELSFSKAWSSSFERPFPFILHRNEARVGGWDFLSAQVYCLPKHSNQYCKYGFSAMFYIIESWLKFQLGICMLLKVVQYSAMFLCFQIKV